MRASSIRSHLLLLVLAVSIPLAAAVGYGIYHDHRQAVGKAKATLRTLAQMMANNTGGRIAEVRRTLESLAERPLVRRVDPKHCDPALKELLVLFPEHANIVYTDLAGLAVCSAVAQPGGRPVNVGGTPWFQKFLREKRFSVGQPHVGPITGKWVLALSAPIHNERGELAGAIHMPLDIRAYDPNIPDQFLPEGSRYGFFAEDGIMIWRNLDPEGVIGTRPNAEAARRIVELRDGEFESLAIDGVVRFFSVVPMPEVGWVAFVGVPAASVYAEARRDAIVLSLGALGVIGLIALLAIFIARRIAGPVAELEQAARAVHEGNLGVRAPVAGPSEVAEVARKFNAMIEAQQRSHARNVEAEAALRLSEERFRDLTELSSDWFWEQDADFRFTLVSGTDLGKGAYLERQILGMRRWELPMIEGVGEDAWAQHRALLDQHKPFRDFAYRVRKPDGTIGWNSIAGRPVFAPDGRFLGYRGTGNDITPRVEAAEAVHRLNESLEQRVRERTAELEASNRELEAFSYSVSHDLRAPLRALDGFSYLLKEEYAERLDETGQDYLRRIREASQRMGTLIDDLIELARISRLEMQRVDLDLSTLALEVAETLREQAPRRQVSWDIAPGLRAHADLVLAKALMDNLLRNAWKFTAEREAGRIKVGCEHLNGETVFFVRDNGAGFDQTYADKLFKAFQRLHDAKRFPGTGIGLATVMRVVRRHGGRAWAEGVPEQGAAFYFTLP